MKTSNLSTCHAIKPLWILRPPYFRNEKNYPWIIEGFYKAGGTQDKTFNGYSMVADYFQTNLIEKLADFITPLVP